MIMRRTLLAIGLALGMTTSVIGQTLQPPLTNPAKPPLGSVCETPKLRGQGIIKEDLCGRLYCGIRDFAEPFQKRDYSRKRMPCEFKVVKNICTCVPEGKK